MTIEKRETYAVRCDFCDVVCKVEALDQTPPSDWTVFGGVHACKACSDKPVALREVAKISARNAAGAEDDCG